MFIKLFAGIGALWVLLGIFTAIRFWGETTQLQMAVTQALIGIFNMAVAWYLYRKAGRLSGRRR